MRMKRRRQRRKGPEEGVQRTITSTLTRKSRMVLKGFPSHAGTKEQKHWVTFPHGETDWDGMLRQFAVRFGVTRPRNVFKQECIRNLNWKSFSYDGTFNQRLWLIKAAQQGTPWIQMLPFNKGFKTHRISEEFETQFKAMRHYCNPTTPGDSKLRWARGSTNHRLQSTLFPLKKDPPSIDTGRRRLSLPEKNGKGRLDGHWC